MTIEGAVQPWTPGFVVRRNFLAWPPLKQSGGKLASAGANSGRLNSDGAASCEM